MPQKSKPDGIKVKSLARGFVLSIMVLVIALGMLRPSTVQAGDSWLYFARDASSPSKKYYYDLESVRYNSNDHVSTWIKMSGALGEQTMEAEINCSGRLFRLIQTPPKDMWDTLLRTKPSRTQYVVAGWFEIPPDSEIHILRKLLCNNPLKDY